MNTQWKPIASAPENEGRPLFCELCWGPEGDQSVGTGFRHNGKWYAAGLFFCLGQEKRYELREVEVQPTHWKPQSDLPDEESAAPTSHPIPTGATGEDMRARVMEVITGVWDRETRIDDAADEVIDILSPAPAAGDALDAKRYRWLRNNVWVAANEFRIMNPNLRYVAPRADVEIDAFIDAGMAAQCKGDA
ncbi:hypothetical protein YH64_009120 [Achromobacter sp. LC458]|uniref:hypothetical protein n=1 Tax=Achromobacter sp. LC458 TaxID=1120623 RepID=UPI000629FC28|nr:hypothetical protein [Achromobacter sp. LC458]TRM53251.1 hypothetical protein YH64_009120 [Achromobacter sp. LC458]